MQQKYKSILTKIIFVFCVLLFANNAVASLPTCPPKGGTTEVILFPNSEDASSYYECVEGYPVAMCCPLDLYFCSEKGACSFEWDTECSFDDTKMPDPDDSGYEHCWYYHNPPLPDCPCYTGTPTTETVNIYGGVKKTITTPKGCTAGYCNCGNCPGTTVEYSCECNSGYTATNQGSKSCNCIQCPAGSYVGGSMSAPACTPCPKNNDIAQTVGSSAANNTSTSPTSCYLPKDTTYTDTTGGYSFTTQCDYGL